MNDHYLITYEDYGKEPKHVAIVHTWEEACEVIRQRLDVAKLDDSAWKKGDGLTEYVIGDAAYVVRWITMTRKFDINTLMANIRTWQTLSDRYTAACEEARQINDGKHYPSSPGRRASIKALDDHAMELIHDVHNDAVLEMLIALANEVERQKKRVQSLRITLWETERDANTALKLLKVKNYENVGNLCELIALSVNDALKIDTERE